MSLFLRLIWLFLTQTRGQRADVLATTRVTTTTMPNDLDLNRHVNNGRYLTLADLGRVDWFYRTRALQVAFKQRAFPIIGDATARFVKQMKAFEKLSIESRLLGWDDKWAFMEHRLLNGRGELVALVVIRGMFWSRKGGLKPAEMIRLAGHGERVSPALEGWVSTWVDSLDQLSAAARAARGQESAA